MNKKNCKLGS
uniref:Uncharacterized protein n=1 Tax=Anguilla anguilla TaxID=7936 RepID=A0A0E9W4Q1_ANGAN